MFNKAEQLNNRTKEKLQRDVENLIADMGTQLKSPVYSRSVNLPAVYRLQYAFEADDPNLTTPKEEDVAHTVHIIACLEGQLAVEDYKTNSGLYERDYGKLMRLHHAIWVENGYLARQLSIIRQREEMNKPVESAPIVHEGASQKKAKAA